MLSFLSLTFMLLKINGYSYFPYREIFVNGIPFYLVDETKNAKYYKSVGSFNISISRIFCIEGKVDQSIRGLEGFVTYKIEVGNKKFVRRMENFFIPENLTEEDIINFFNLIASQYDELIDKELNDKITGKIFKVIHRCKRAFSIPGDFRVLDYGVGTGNSFRIYKKNQYKGSKFALFGCDISEKMILICKKKQIANVILCEYNKLPYKSETFDAVFAVFVVHYFINEEPYKEIFRVLKPRGVFIFNVKAPSEPKTYEQILYQVGFQNVKIYSWFINTPQKAREISIIRAQKQ